MPKQKSHKGLAKRVKVTATGKIKRQRANGSHLMSVKNAKRRRRIGSSSLVLGKLVKKLRSELGK